MTEPKLKKINILSDFKEFINTHPSLITLIKLSSDSKYIITGSKNGLIKGYDIISLDLIKTFYHFSQDISSFDVTHDNSLIISDTKDNFIRLWDFKSNKLNNMISAHNNSIISLKFLNTYKYSSVGLWIDL